MKNYTVTIKDLTWKQLGDVLEIFSCAECSDKINPEISAHEVFQKNQNPKSEVKSDITTKDLGKFFDEVFGKPAPASTPSLSTFLRDVLGEPAKIGGIDVFTLAPSSNLSPIDFIVTGFDTRRPRHHMIDAMSYAGIGHQTAERMLEQHIKDGKEILVTTVRQDAPDPVAGLTRLDILCEKFSRAGAQFRAQAQKS